MNQLYQPKQTLNLRRNLRRDTTETERILWSHLRKKQLGYKLTRQYGIGTYILDFYCAEKRLAIEIDGSQHAEEYALVYDQKRTQFLNQSDIQVLRFWNTDIFNDLAVVLDQIALALNSKNSIPSG